MCRLMGTRGLRKKMKWLLFGVVGGPVATKRTLPLWAVRVLSPQGLSLFLSMPSSNQQTWVRRMWAVVRGTVTTARETRVWGDVGHGKAVRCSLALTRPCSRDESDPGVILRPAAHYYISMCDVCGRLPSVPSLWSHTGGKRITDSQREAPTRTDAIAQPGHLAVAVDALADVAVARGRLPRSTIVFCVSWNRIAAWGGTRRR